MMRTLESVARIGALLVMTAAAASAQSRAFHVAHYDLALELPDAGKTIDGVATLTVVRTARGDTLTLDLVDLTVRRVLVRGAAVTFGRDAGHIRIPVGAGRVGDTLRVAVEYRGAPKDGLVISTDSAGRWLAFGDNWPDRGRLWIPSIDHPSDKSTVTWTVNAPSALTVVANGTLVETTPLPQAKDPDGAAGRAIARTRTVWRESRPIPVYLMVIAAAPLVRYDLGNTACGFAEGGGCVAQQVYVAPEQQKILPGEFARAGDIVTYFSRLIGPFPYEKLAHLQSSTRFGGMENASAIFYADAMFRRQGAGTSIIAHETAHQWFGDAVTEREWSHAWLSEGFATYFAALYMGRAYGDSAMTAALKRDRDGLFTSNVVATRPVVDTLQTNLMAMLNDNSYQKGGWVLHMLRAEVGDSAFFGGLRDYHAAHRHGTALTDDLMQAVEKRAGRSLGWFFDQWLRKPGYAELTTAWRYDAAAKRVQLTVEQGTRFGTYRVPLTMDVTDATGVAHRVTVQLPAQGSATVTVPLPLDAAPRAVMFDPAVGLLAKITSK